MAHLNEAMTIAHHAYVWDNSKQGAGTLFCEMKRPESGIVWNIQAEQVPVWFMEHFLSDHPKDPYLSNVYADAMNHYLGLYGQQ